jgi:hypothetical protein
MKAWPQRKKAAGKGKTEVKPENSIAVIFKALPFIFLKQIRLTYLYEHGFSRTV